MGYTLEQLQRMGATPINSGSQPAPIEEPKKKYTLSELQALGATPAPQEKQPSFVGSIIRDIARPFANIGQNVKAIPLALQGKSMEEINKELTVQNPYLGEIHPVGTTKGSFGENLKEAVGTGLNIASNLPLASGANLGYQGLKTALKEGVGSLAKRALPIIGEGALYGGSYGTGRALEEGKSIPQALGEGAIGAGLGAAGSAVLGVGGPFLAGGTKELVGKTKNLFNKEQAVNSLENKYTELLTGQSPSKAKKFKAAQDITEAKNKAGTEGLPPQRILAEAGIIPKQEGSRLSTLQQADELRATTAPLRDANRSALREVELATPKINLDQVETDIINRIRSSDVKSTVKQSMEQRARNELMATRAEYGPEVTISTLDDLKSKHWDYAFKNKGLVEADILQKNSDYAIAKEYQKMIEETARKAGFDDVAQLNRHIGDILGAADFLENLNGKTLNFGRLGRLFAMGIGSTMGNSFLGKILGAMGGDAVANILISQSVAGPVKRLVLREIQKKDPVAYTRAIQWLDQQKLLKDTRLQLPAPQAGRSYLNQGRAIPIFTTNKPGVEYVGKEASVGKYQPLPQAARPQEKNPIFILSKKDRKIIRSKPVTEQKYTPMYRKNLPIIQAGKGSKKKGELPTIY